MQCRHKDAARAQDRRRHAARNARRRAEARHAAEEARRRRDIPVLARSRSHRTRDQADLPAGVLRQGAPHVGRQALRRQDAALRHRAARPRHRPPRRRRHAGDARRGIRDGHPHVGSRPLAGRRHRGERRMDAGGNAARLRSLHRDLRNRAARAWRRRLADERPRASPHAASGLRVLLGRPRHASPLAGVARRADPLPAASHDAADARRADRPRRRSTSATSPRTCWS